jgi:hypothetical protein
MQRAKPPVAAAAKGCARTRVDVRERPARYTGNVFPFDGVAGGSKRFNAFFGGDGDRSRYCAYAGMIVNGTMQPAFLKEGNSGRRRAAQRGRRWNAARFSGAVEEGSGTVLS